nr:hypothetical protein [uncultured bacterium]
MKPITHVKAFFLVVFCVNIIATIYLAFIVQLIDQRYIPLAIASFPFIFMMESTKSWVACIIVWPIFLWPVAFYRQVWGRMLIYTSLAVILVLDIITLKMFLMAGGT